MGFFSDAVSLFLPILGTALGGPAGGLAGGAIATQINRPPTGGMAPPPTFTTPPSEEPSFFAAIGTALLPVAGAVLQQQVAPSVPTTTIAIEPGALGPFAGQFTTAQRQAQFAEREAARRAGLLAAARAAAVQPSTLDQISGTSLVIPTALVTGARLIGQAAASPLIGGAVGSAVGTAVALRSQAVTIPGTIPVVPGTNVPASITRGFALPGGGAGGTVRQTIVQTVDRATGNVVRQDVFRGAPFLMNHDITVAKKVFRVAQKLHGRLPRRSVRKRVIEAPPINQFITERVLSHALQSPK